jgi:hypothetical protein
MVRFCYFCCRACHDLDVRPPGLTALAWNRLKRQGGERYWAVWADDVDDDDDEIDDD